MTGLRAIGWDLDNTLYDHAQFVEGAYRRVAAAAERATGRFSAEEFFALTWPRWQLLGSRCAHLFADALREFGCHSAPLEQELVAAYRGHRPERLTPFPGAIAALEALRSAGWRVGLLTDGQPEVQAHKVRALGLAPHCDGIVCTGELGREFYKPHPAGFRALAAALGVAPSALGYVGDNPHCDFAAPRALGMMTLRVLTGEYRALPSAPGEVDRTFSTAAEAAHWLLAQRPAHAA